MSLLLIDTTGGMNQINSFHGVPEFAFNGQNEAP